MIHSYSGQTLPEGLEPRNEIPLRWQLMYDSNKKELRSRLIEWTQEQYDKQCNVG